AVEHEAAAYAGSHPNAEDVAAVFGIGPCGLGACAENELAPDGAVDVVIDDDRALEALAQEIAQGRVVPLEVGSFEDDAARDVDGAGRCDADGGDVFQVDASVVACLVDGADDAADDMGLAFFGFGLLALAADDAI